LANFVTLDGGDHGTFGMYNGDDYVELLTRELTDQRPAEYTRSTVTIEYSVNKESSGWCEDDGEWYYCGEDGGDGGKDYEGKDYDGWCEDDGDWYYCGEGDGKDGSKDSSGWCEVDGEWYECEDDGLSRGAVIGLSVGVAAIGIGVALYFVLRS